MTFYIKLHNFINSWTKFLHILRKLDFKDFNEVLIQCLAEKLAVSLSGIRKAAVVFVLDELQKSLIHGLKELEICHKLQH